MLRVLFIWALVIVLAGCAAKKGKPGDETAQQAPLALLVERIIEGEVLGEALSDPYGVAVAFDGQVYVVDAGNHRLLKFDSTFKPLAQTGGHGFSGGLLNRPSFVTVDNALNVLVTDEGNRRIARFNSRLNFVEEILFEDEDDPFKLGIPSGLAATSYGELWVADRDMNRIAVFDNVGNFDRFVGDYGYSGGQLAGPEDIALMPGEGFLVCDAGHGRVVIYDSYGNFDREFRPAGLNYPAAAAAHDRSFWIVDGALTRVLMLDSRGNRLFGAGPGLPGSVEALDTPSDVAILSDGRLLVSDSGNNRLLICRPVGPNE